jgi:AcrR family transcriptional regulator
MQLILQRARTMIGKKSAEKSVTEVRLVEAAAQLFARQGFKATTTREIAQLADLNEVTLFRYFSRKPDLFLAALESHLSRIKLSHDLQRSLAADDAPAIVLPMVITFVVNTLTKQPELQHLLHVAGFELPEADEMIRDHLGPIFDVLCAYFKRLADKGAVRPVEPALAVLSLLGTVAANQGLRERYTKERHPQSDTEQAIAEYASICLQGLRPSPKPNPNPSQREVVFESTGGRRVSVQSSDIAPICPRTGLASIINSSI